MFKKFFVYFLQTVELYHLAVDDQMDSLMTIAMERGLKTNFNDLIDFMDSEEIEIDHQVSIFTSSFVYAAALSSLTSCLARFFF